jgi:hypothetical protein
LSSYRFRVADPNVLLSGLLTNHPLSFEIADFGNSQKRSSKRHSGCSSGISSGAVVHDVYSTLQFK